jgi:drug/metabolite transporter (DMT)-like permease
VNFKTFKYDSLMLLTAVIWGFAFVAQRVGMEHVGPFTFNALRFALGALVLIPIIIMQPRNWSLRGNAATKQSHFPPYVSTGEHKGGPINSAVRCLHLTANPLLLGAFLSGLALFGGSTFQQIGIIYTTAGKAGFITGLYVILVPISGALWGQKIGLNTWLGALFVTLGLYLLTMTGLFSINLGDGLVLVCALFWTVHVHLIGYFSTRVDVIKLAFLQFAVCSLLSLVIALIIETNSLASILKAALPILYAGCLSVGIAYTLQVVAQRHVPPSHAAIILSLEAVFAGIGGWLILGEVLSFRGFLGCLLMLAGMVVSHLHRHADTSLRA